MVNVVDKNNQIGSYKGKYFVMGKKAKGKSPFEKACEHPIISSVISASIISLVSLFLSNIISIRIIDVRLSLLETSIKSDFDRVQKNIDTINSDFSDYQKSTNTAINNITYSIGQLEGKISIMESSNVKQIASTGELSDLIKAHYQNDENICNGKDEKISTSFQKYVATDAVSGDQYTITDLENEALIMIYEENGEEVFFKGQFDEKGYWKDNCVINRYKDNQLVMIMDAVYDSGKLTSYQQVFPYKTLAGNDVWVFSNRTVTTDSQNSEGISGNGETYMYFRNGEYDKGFDNKDISNIDIVNAKDFRKLVDLNIEGYYNGYTSNGKFNDDTQNAYLVKYNETGDVRYLYVGKIRNGLPHDDTGNAWSISWGYADDGYYYYKGTFSKGDHDATPKPWDPMTPEEIRAVVNPDNFSCPLTGLIDNPL